MEYEKLKSYLTIRFTVVVSVYVMCKELQPVKVTGGLPKSVNDKLNK